MKKVASALLAITLIIGVLCALPFTANADSEFDAEIANAVPLELYAEATASFVLDGEDCAWFSFTPGETGEYRFTSYYTYNSIYRIPLVLLFDSDGEFIDFDLDSGEDYNFSLKSTLTSGKTYYYLVTAYYAEHVEGSLLSFQVCLESAKEIKSIEVIGNSKPVYVRNIDNHWINIGYISNLYRIYKKYLTIRITYIDGTTRDFRGDKLRGFDTDYGNQENLEWGADGEYTINVSLLYEGIEYKAFYKVRLGTLAEASEPIALNTETNIDYTAYFSFTTIADGYYTLSVKEAYNERFGIVLYDQDGNFVEKAYDIHSIYLEKGKTYYYRVDCYDNISFNYNVLLSFSHYDSSHSWGAWHVTKESSCEYGGEEKRDCIYCNVYQIRQTQTKEHSFSKWKTVREASCCCAGEAIRACSDCGVYQYREITANTNAHKWGKWITTKQATAKTNGEEVRFCENGCGKNEKQTIPKLEVKTKAVKPTADKKSGTYTGSVKVSLKAHSPSAKIYYTTDGTKPTRNSKFVNSGKTLTFKKTTTVKFMVVAPDYLDSAVASNTYTIKTENPGTKAVPKSKKVKKNTKIKLTAPKNTTLYYTTKNKKPTMKSAKIKPGKSAVIKINKATTLKVIAVKVGCKPSSVVSKTYKLFESK